MTSLAQRNPQAWGVLVTPAGVMIFVPDAPAMRRIGGDMLALAFWRGRVAGGGILPGSMAACGDWFGRKGLPAFGQEAGGRTTFAVAPRIGTGFGFGRSCAFLTALAKVFRHV